MSEYLWLIPALPLLGAIINGAIALMGRRPKALIHGVAIGVMLASFIFSLMAVADVSSGGKTLFLKLFTWISSGLLSVDALLAVDQLTGLMLLIITGLGTLIHLYSVGYMDYEPSYARFFSYLNLLVFFMLILVMGGNLVISFLGWQGVSMVSYLLIGFWYEEPDTVAAGTKAFIFNRIGDLGFLMGLCLLFWSLGTSATFNYHQLAEVVPRSFSLNGPEVNSICLLLFVGACAKSAQFPLHTWLPDSTAAPAPVSALIHAATTVPAGIYLITRLSSLFVLAPKAMMLIAIVGALSAFFAATLGLVQRDIKKVLAYATLSQVGYMFLAIGVGAFQGAIFHLIAHALFMSCLFLGAGSVIHACHQNEDPQDMLQMGGLKKYMPITYYSYLLSTLAISGVIGTSGFFSKTEILSRVLHADGSYIPPALAMALWIVGTAGVLITTFSMFRSVYMTFHGAFRGGKTGEEHVQEAPWTMTTPLVILSALALFTGWAHAPLIRRSLYLEADTLGWLQGWLLPAITEPTFQISTLSQEWALVIALQIAIFACWFLAKTFYVDKPEVLPAKAASIAGGKIHKLLINKYYVDDLYKTLVVTPIFKLSDWVLYKALDQAIIDGVVNGTGTVAQALGEALGRLQSGNVQIVLFFAVGGLAAIVGFWYLM